MPFRLSFSYAKYVVKELADVPFCIGFGHNTAKAIVLVGSVISLYLLHFIFMIQIKEDNTIIRDGLAIAALLCHSPILLPA